MSNSVDVQLLRSFSRDTLLAYAHRITRIPRARFAISALSYVNSSGSSNARGNTALLADDTASEAATEINVT